MYFGNEGFVYDVLGNPTMYKGKACTWQNGRQLRTYSDMTFEYDAQGRRTSKKQGDKTTVYTYDSNGNLLKQSDGTNTLEFQYDHNGLLGVKHGTKQYFYRKDIQGNIFAILDSSGVVVVRYTYDAWGEQDEQVLNSACNAIAQLNPFRYRSYYYDVETKLYYLKTRYYDPQVGRFITIDGITCMSDSINGLNLYAYCANNPIMHIDTNGMDWGDFWNGVKEFFKGVGKFVGGLAIAAFGWCMTWGTLPIAAAIPGLGFLTQAGASIFAYGGFMVASVFSSEINADMNEIGWNPFNTDENKVLNSTRVSFYKGVPVVRYSGPGGRSGTFLWTLLDNDPTYPPTVDTVRHEWGHAIQQGIVGPLRFLATYAISSMAGLGKHKWPDGYGPTDPYYKRPWEITADYFGGVTYRLHTDSEMALGWWYMAVTLVGGVLSYFFII